MKNISKKTIIIFLILSLLLSISTPLLTEVVAWTSGSYTISTLISYDTAIAQSSDSNYPIKYYKNYTSYSSVICDMVGYYDTSGNWYPAYCLNKELDGAEAYSGGYSVNINSYYSDSRIYTILVNGYGYKSASDLGVESDYDAFVATKMAIYSIIYSLDPSTYFASTGSSRSNAIYNAIQNLVYLANYATTSYTEVVATASASGDLYQSTINGTDYAIQKYVVTSNIAFESYTLSYQYFTTNTVIYNSDFSSTITNGSSTNATEFYVAIPISEITSSFSAIINLQNIKVASYPILYAETTVSGTQNYVTITDPYEYENVDTVLTISVPTVNIYKYDRDTGEALSGAYYDIYEDTNLNGVLDDEDTYIMTVGATDSEGHTSFGGLEVGQYIATEITTPEGYNLDSADMVFNITLNGSDITLSSTDTAVTVIYKQARDGENEGEYLEGAVYEVWLDVDGDGEIDEDVDELVDTTEPTDSTGKTTVTSLEVGDYIVREIEAPEGYNLDSEESQFTITTDGGSVDIYTDDTVITSEITVYKEATTDSEITGLTAGTLLANATFEIYDEDGELVDTITTDETGKAQIELEYGVYTIKEVEEPEYYLLNEENEATITVDTDGEEIELTFGDEAVRLGLEITKTGIVQTQANDEIRYDFTIQNNSNVDVDNFTWRDELPYEYITITSLFTGTYNYEHDYTVWYLLEGEDEWVQILNEDTEDGTYSTLENNYIDFSSIDGTVVQFKLEFGTVEGDFASNSDDTPFIFCKVKDTVGANDSWTNYTYLTGDYTSNQGSIVYLEDQDEWTTNSYAYSLSISKLPQTGF